jgi:RNA polymerase sigma factor (sigma-70 family)
MQETFVRAMRSAEGLREPARVRSYLFTTAHNLVRNHHRRAKVSPLVGSAPEREPADHGSSDARVRLRGLLERLAELLSSMPDAHRQAFELGVLDRLPYREIADRTGWTLAQVKINVYRARRRAVDGLADVLGDREVLQ